MKIWALAKKVVLFEFRIYRNLLRWVFRRPDVHGEPFGYAQLVAPVLWLWIFGSAVETVVVHFLLPWEGMRLVADLLGIWGLIWMVGFLGGMKVYPHLLTESALRVRHSGTVDLNLPLDAIESIAAERQELPSSIRKLQPLDTERGTDLRVGVSGEVNVRVTLRRPTVVHTPAGPVEVVSVRFLADDPKKLVARAKQHLAAPSGAA